MGRGNGKADHASLTILSSSSGALLGKECIINSGEQRIVIYLKPQAKLCAIQSAHSG
ncbi:MAG: hypothetical protein ACL7BU_07060 [Candidatus Phlomobacter fragariae]